jgi:hypothetical protein
MLIGFWVGRPEGKRPLGRPKRKWEDNIKIDLQGVRWGNRLDCSGSEKGHAVMNLRVP